MILIKGKVPHKNAGFFNKTLNPLTDIYHSLTGKDFITGEKISRAEGLLGIGLTVIGGKAEIAVAKTVEKAIASQAVEGGINVAKGGSQGGLSLFKWGAEQTTKSTGWKAGDYKLHLPNK